MYRIRILPDPWTIPRFADLAKQAIRFFRSPTPAVGVLQESGVLLEDEPGVVSSNLFGDEVRDVAASAAWARDHVDERERLFGQRDVRAHETHDV
jgi:hypothetical protein